MSNHPSEQPTNIVQEELGQNLGNDLSSEQSPVRDSLGASEAFTPDSGESNPFQPDEDVRQDTEQLRSNMAMYDAVIGLSEQETEPSETYNAAIITPSSAIKSKIVSESEARNLSAVDDAVNSILNGLGDSTEDPASLLAEVPTEAQRIQGDSIKPWAAQLAVVDSMDRFSEQSSEFKDKVALQSWFYEEHIAGLADQLGMNMDTASDVAGLLFLSDESLDISRVVGTFFGSAEGWNRYIQTFQTLDAKDQAAAFSFLKDEITEATDGNALKTLSFLTQLLDPESSTEVSVGQFLDKIGLAASPLAIPGTLANIGKVMAKLSKGATVLRNAKKMNNTDLGAEITSRAANQPEVAEAMNLDRSDIAATISPFNNESMFEGASDGFARATKDKFDQIDKFLDNTDVLEEGLGLTEVEIANKVKKIRNDLKEQVEVDNIDVSLSKDGKSIDINYDKADADGNVVPIRESKPFEVDDITGGFKKPKLTGVGVVGAAGKVLSPNFIFKEDRGQLVDSFTRTMFASDKLRSRYNKVLDTVINPVKGNKESVAKLDEVLLMGDENQRVYSYQELVNDGVDGVRLSDTEYEVYARLRHVMDKAFSIKNVEVRNTLVAQGLKEVSVDGAKSVSKTYDSVQSATSALSGSKFTTAFIDDPKLGKTVLNLDNELLKQKYEEGYVLAKSGDNDFYNVGDGAYAKYILTRAEDIKEVPTTVLKQNVGYIPRDYQDSFYFVKSNKYGVVDGQRTIVGVKTERYFDNLKDAKTFSDELKLEKALPDEDVRVLADREVAQQEFDKEAIGISGGLYTSTRGSEALTFGLNGDKGKRIDSMESISKYYSTMAQRIPMSEFRLGITRRWLNQAKESGLLPENFSGNFNTALKEISPDADAATAAFLRESHKQIAFQIGIPTDEEKIFTSAMRTSMNWLEEKEFMGQKQITKAMHKLDHTNPIAAAKSSVYHAFLGLGVPVQTLVQGLGATIPLSIDPANAIKGLKRSMTLSYLDNMQDPNVISKNASALGKGDVDLTDAEEFHKLWRKTGLYESVVSSSGDLDAVAKGYHIGKFQAKQIFDKGLFFFKAGELFNRRTSFSMAYEWYKGLNPGKKIGDNELKEILARTDVLLLSMTKSNKAGFQKGLLSVPTQFMQVQTKFIELVAGNTLTMKEKIRLMVSQGVLFGSVGIPMASLFDDNAMTAMNIDVGDLTEAQKAAVKGGLITTMFRSGMGIEVTVSSRTAVAAGLEDLFLGVFEEKASVWEIASGAFGGLVDRTFTSVEDIYNLGKISFNGGDEIPSGLWKTAVDSTLSIASSWNNASKAWEVHNTKLLKNTKGQVVEELHGLNIQTTIAMGLGLAHKDLEEIFNANTGDINAAKRLQEKGDAFMSLVSSVITNSNDEEKSKVANIVWESMMSSETEATRRLIYKSVSKRLLNPESIKEKIIKKQIQQYFNNQSSNDDVLNELIPNFNGDQ